MKQSSNPAEPALSAPIQSSPPFPRCSEPNAMEIKIAEGQKPIPVVSENCGYPRAEYSSKNPTNRNATPHPAPYFKISPPCSAIAPKLKTPASRSDTSRIVIATNPKIAPCQKFFPKAFRAGRP